GATVVDGTGAPRRAADVVVRDGAVAAVVAPGEGGAVASTDAPTVDLTGLVLAPGFVDPHTHDDAQVLWDPDLTPSSWHGVTTVVTGNCGFSVAPTRARDRSAMVGTLENVEDMDRAALEAGIPWGFETFAEYLDVVASGPLRLGVACMVGHTALRTWAMGDAAVERPARPDEIDAMAAALREALAAGAVGLATSRSSSHVGHRARPVASRM